MTSPPTPTAAQGSRYTDRFPPGLDDSEKVMLFFLGFFCGTILIAFIVGTFL